MDLTHKTDPCDYTIRELPALCAAMDDCEQCPIRDLDGPCHGGGIPCNWNLPDPEPGPAPDPQTMQEVAQELAKELAPVLGPVLAETIHATCEGIKTVTAMLKTASEKQGHAQEDDADD